MHCLERCLIPKRYRLEQEKRLKDEEEAYQSLLVKDKELDSLNRELGNRVSEITHLYDVTREMSKSLDFWEIFAIFKKSLKESFRFEQCELVLHQKDQPSFKESHFRLFPLRSEGGIVGYLAIKGLKTDDFDNFSILLDQLAMEIEKAKLYQTIQERAIRDGLTHIYVRRHFLDLFHEEFGRAERHKSDISFLMADIDHFKECNDKYGHLVGDAVLKQVAAIIKGSIREIDLVGRYGGEEFSVALPTTNKKSALHVAERIRTAIEHHRFEAYKEMMDITISLGVAVFPDHANDAQELIDNADTALYQAKRMGRNRVSVYSALPLGEVKK